MENKEQQPLEEVEEATAEDKQEEEIQPLRMSRRDFLIGAGSGAVVGAAAAASAVSILRPGAPEVKEAMKEIPAEVPAEEVLAEMEPVTSQTITLKVNGQDHTLHVQAYWTLAEVLRAKLGLTGAKIGCNLAMCGACTVLMDGKPVNACQQLAIRTDGREILTVEGLNQGEKLHPVQQAFIEKHGFQCAFCTPGRIMSAVALLNENPNPTRKEVQKALGGNLCRCGAYIRAVDAVLAAAEMMA